jgi:hypothetical protein
MKYNESAPTMKAARHVPILVTIIIQPFSPVMNVDEKTRNITNAVIIEDSKKLVSF